MDHGPLPASCHGIWNQKDGKEGSWVSRPAVRTDSSNPGQQRGVAVRLSESFHFFLPWRHPFARPPDNSHGCLRTNQLKPRAGRPTVPAIPPCSAGVARLPLISRPPNAAPAVCCTTINPRKPATRWSVSSGRATPRFQACHRPIGTRAVQQHEQQAGTVGN